MDDVKNIIERNLASFPKRKKEVEIGFFGGNFTGIPIDEQEAFLEIANSYLRDGKIDGIRISTRPDYINEQIIKLLRKYKVSTVELGAQSMVDEVLKKTGRGHTVADTLKSAEMIKTAGIRLGLQMMIGLPGDDAPSDIQTAEAFVDLEADDSRIYPCLVIQGTELEKQYREGKYQPLGIDEAVQRSAAVFKVLEAGGVRVIKMGLHPADAFLRGDALVAGPFHEAFRELVMTEIWADEFAPLMLKPDKEHLELYIHPKQFNFAIGYAAKNKKALLKFYKTVVFFKDDKLEKREYHAHYH